MPPETQTVVWTLWTVAGVLAAIVVAMGAVIWGRIVKRPEEVNAAAKDGDRTLAAADQSLATRIDKMADTVQQIALDVALANQALSSIQKGIRAGVKDFHDLRQAVQENREDIAVMGGAVAVIQNHLDLTPIPTVRRPRRPVTVPPPPPDDDDDDDGSSGANGG